MIVKENALVWVDESRCKACDVCVSYCPAGVLGMRLEPKDAVTVSFTVLILPFMWLIKALNLQS